MPQSSYAYNISLTLFSRCTSLIVIIEKYYLVNNMHEECIFMPVRYNTAISPVHVIPANIHTRNDNTLHDQLRFRIVVPVSLRRQYNNNNNNNVGRIGSCLTWLATSLEERRRWPITFHRFVTHSNID